MPTKNLILIIFLLSNTVKANEPTQLEKGQTVYKTNCITCHGESFDGMGDAGKYLSPRPRNLVTDKFVGGDTVEQIHATITNGLKGTAMPSFINLSESDRTLVSAYIFSVRKKK